MAQRAPVLRQIKVPHSYYFREMYLPQVTSGPNGPTWSPDGQELIYSMQGTLWRQRIGSLESRQLTSGPGYDYQPDWSPDGQSVVYTSYRNDAMELRLLDLASGESRSLLADGAVNVEPRWSPDGTRLVYVSTAFEGRWHVFVASISANQGLADIQRITEDHASGLPRYYYGGYDQYLSPTWSPDGKDLILISNRSHIWGSGGFWRMGAHPGATLKEIHYEETTWRARPDWSRNGNRVVYSSYLGTQRNQLWLMPADGGDPFQLTYEEGDATAPRWSPDGRRIAYVSNEDGNPELRIVDVPGGAVQRVRATRRIYAAPVGRIQLTVVGGAPARPMPARVSLTGPDGRSYAPDETWRYADDGFDRGERKIEYGYFHTPGSSVITVPAGAYRLEVSHGPEYRVYDSTVTVTSNPANPVRVVLQRLADMPAAGWFSGDLHVHMNYGGTYRNTPRRLAAQAQAEDLHLVENLIVNKEGRVPDIGWFTGRPDVASSHGTLILHDQEYHTSYWGHIGLLGLRRNFILPAYSAYVQTAAASLYPTNAAIMDLAHQEGGITGYVHPFDFYPDPADSTKPLTDELPVDVALGKVDYYETIGFADDYAATAKIWYQLLNCGFRIPAGAGTDAMANFASLRGPVGLNRVFVKSGVLEQRRWLAALKAGKSFATNGPLLDFSLDGHGIGSEIRLPAGPHHLIARVTLRSYVPVDTLEVVRNGEVVATIPLGGNRRSVSHRVRIPVASSGWYVLRARGAGPAYPILDVYPYAVTSPIYVTVAGKPVRSPEDAKYFLRWIDRLETAAERNSDWSSAQEKTRVMQTLREARAEFERRAAS